MTEELSSTLTNLTALPANLSHTTRVPLSSKLKKTPPPQHISSTYPDGNPLNLYIDAADPKWGYARNSDDPFHNETENAK